MSTPDPFEHRPPLAALLRLAAEQVTETLYARTVASGHPDLRPAHFRLLRFPGVDGRRPTELAESLGTTKQAIHPLLNELEPWGYIERVADTTDQRGRTIRLTRRGRRLMITVRKLHAEIEDARREQLGDRAFQQLIDALQVLAASAEGDGGPGRDGPPRRLRS